MRQARTAVRNPRARARRAGLLPTRRRWWRTVALAHVAAVAGHRADLRRGLTAYVDVLYRAARWDGTTCILAAEIARLVRVDVATIRRYRARLEDAGLLFLLEEGSTPATRRAAPAEGNRAPVYLLTRPPGPRPAREPVPGEMRAPVSSPEGEEIHQPNYPPCPPRCARRNRPGKRGRWRQAEHEVVEGLLLELVRADSVGATAWGGTFLGITPADVRRELRRAGMLTLPAPVIAYMLDKRPDLGRWPEADGPRHARAVLRYRLTLWAGNVARYGARAVAAPAYAALAARERRREEAAGRRRVRAEELFDARAAAVPPPPAADPARPRREAYALRPENRAGEDRRRALAAALAPAGGPQPPVEGERPSARSRILTKSRPASAYAAAVRSQPSATASATNSERPATRRAAERFERAERLRSRIASIAARSSATSSGQGPGSLTPTPLPRR